MTEATRIGVPMNVAMVDAGTNLVAFVPMNGAWPGRIDIAIKGVQGSSLRHGDGGPRQD